MHSSVFALFFSLHNLTDPLLYLNILAMDGMQPLPVLSISHIR